MLIREVIELSGRAPRGARGLKHPAPFGLNRDLVSRPARGAWIETSIIALTDVTSRVAPREGRVD